MANVTASMRPITGQAEGSGRITPICARTGPLPQ
jgi:hypothetical protein